MVNSRRWSRIIGGSICAGILTASTASPVTFAEESKPLYSGTVFVGSQVITPQSPTDHSGLTPMGLGNRLTYDRRSGWVTESSHLFSANFTGTGPVEIVVDPEIGDAAAAQVEAARFARIVGQLPRACRTSVDAVWLHPGDADAGGGNRSILIHTDYANRLPEFIEEVMLHECAHTSLDWDWQGSVDRAAWLAAAAADGTFISDYARDNPLREDLAETWLPYFVAKMGPTPGWSAAAIDSLQRSLRHRFALLDSMRLDLAPMTPAALPPAGPTSASAARPGASCSRAELGTRVPQNQRVLRCARVGSRFQWVVVRQQKRERAEAGQGLSGPGAARPAVDVVGSRYN
jgi:hypothetical protein